MRPYTAEDVIAAATAAGADETLAPIMAAAAMSEGGGDLDAAGDYDSAGVAHSFGPYQINDINNVPRSVSTDLQASTDWMFQHEFERAYATGTANGLVAERLARWCCMAAERPYGWGGAGDPGLDSSAADRYAAHWLGIVAGTEPKPPPAAGPPFAYNPDVPAQLQYQSWTCSIRSTMWMLSSLGYPVNVATQQDLMTPWPVGVNVGLLARDGSGLAQFIRDTYGLPCYNVYEATWDDVLAVAGRYPCALGGVGWYHWVGVRRVEEDGGLGLANPAPGYREIWNYLSQDQFEGPLGPFALVVIEVGEEDPVAIAELEAQNAELISKLGYLQGDVANGIQQGLDGAVAATDDAARAPAYDAIQAGINTLRNA